MKIFNKLAIVSLVVLITVNACDPKNNNAAKQVKIDFLLDSLKNIYAPDTRVALWNVSTSESSDTMKLSGEVDNKTAYNDIMGVISNNFQEIEINIDLLPKENFDQLVTGLINNSVANLRSKPKHSAEIATQALLGTPIKILKREEDWYLVQTPNKYLAWVDAPAVVKIGSDDLKDYKFSKKIVYTKQYGFSYSKPDENSQVVSDLVIGCILPITDEQSDFYKVKFPDERIAWVKKDEVEDATEVFDRMIEDEEMIETAKKFVGIPYLWGGTSSKGLDCSGFTSTIYLMNGTVLQRDASQQTKYGEEITTSYDYEQLQVGDLLFYGRKATDSLSERVTHVAMYIGDTEFIHASGRVRINSMDSTRENYIPQYVPRFVRAVRVKGVSNTLGMERIAENDFYKEILN